MTCFTVSGIMLAMVICDLSDGTKVVKACGSHYNIENYIRFHLNEYKFKGSMLPADKQKMFKPIFNSKNEYCGMFRGEKKQ